MLCKLSKSSIQNSSHSLSSLSCCSQNHWLHSAVWHDWTWFSQVIHNWVHSNVLSFSRGLLFQPKYQPMLCCDWSMLINHKGKTALTCAEIKVVQLYCASCKPALKNLTNLHKLLMFPVSLYRTAYVSINMTMCCSWREAPAKKVKLPFMPSVCLYSCHVHPSTSLSLCCLYKFISLSSLWSQHSHQPSSAPLAAPVSAPQGGIPLLLMVFQADVPQSPKHESFLSHIRDCNDRDLCLVLGFVIKTKQTAKH